LSTATCYITSRTASITLQAVGGNIIIIVAARALAEWWRDAVSSTCCTRCVIGRTANTSIAAWYDTVGGIANAGVTRSVANLTIN
jgi:hypothetical protein